MTTPIKPGLQAPQPQVQLRTQSPGAGSAGSAQGTASVRASDDSVKITDSAKALDAASRGEGIDTKRVEEIRARLAEAFDLDHQSCVHHDADGNAVFGHGRLMKSFVIKAPAFGPCFHAACISLDHVGGRADVDLAPIAVDHDLVAGLDDAENLAAMADDGNAERAGHDRHVT